MTLSWFRDISAYCDYSASAPQEFSFVVVCSPGEGGTPASQIPYPIYDLTKKFDTLFMI